MFLPQVTRNKAKTRELRTYRWWAAKRKALIVWRGEPGGQWNLLAASVHAHTKQHECDSNASQTSREFLTTGYAKASREEKTLLQNSSSFGFHTKAPLCLAEWFSRSGSCWAVETGSQVLIYMNPLPPSELLNKEMVNQLKNHTCVSSILTFLWFSLL